MTNTAITPSPLAVQRGWRLARAHGHEWAVRHCPAVSDLSAALASSAAADAVYWRADRLCAGRSAALDAANLQCANAAHALEASIAAAQRAIYAYEGETPRTHAEAIECSTAAQQVNEGAPGIAYTPSEDGHIHHRTGGGTGRLEWDVAPDGATNLRLHRPQGVVAAVTIAVAGDVRVTVNDGLCVRHAEALHVALRALVPAQAERLYREVLLHVEDIEAAAEAARGWAETAERQSSLFGEEGPRRAASAQREADRLAGAVTVRHPRLPRGCTADEARHLVASARAAFLEGS